MRRPPPAQMPVSAASALGPPSGQTSNGERIGRAPRPSGPIPPSRALGAKFYMLAEGVSIGLNYQDVHKRNYMTEPPFVR